MPTYDDEDQDSLDNPRLNIQSSVNREMVVKFRQQIHALGAFWIIMGALAAGLGGAMASGAAGAQGNPLVAKDLAGAGSFFFLLILGLGILWVALGIMACLKQMWAVYVGLAFSYLSLVGNIINFQICAIIILAIVIIQAHRVISWANKMRAADVPLTTLPD